MQEKVEVCLNSPLSLLSGSVELKTKSSLQDCSIVRPSRREMRPVPRIVLRFTLDCRAVDFRAQNFFVSDTQSIPTKKPVDASSFPCTVNRSV